MILFGKRTERRMSAFRSVLSVLSRLLGACTLLRPFGAGALSVAVGAGALAVGSGAALRPFLYFLLFFVAFLGLGLDVHHRFRDLGQLR